MKVQKDCKWSGRKNKSEVLEGRWRNPFKKGRSENLWYMLHTDIENTGLQAPSNDPNFHAKLRKWETIHNLPQQSKEAQFSGYLRAGLFLASSGVPMPMW